MQPIVWFPSRIAGVLIAIAAALFASTDVSAQEAGGARICPLPSTSEEILRLRLAITEYVEPYKLAPLMAWAMRAGHDETLHQWARTRSASANEAKTEFSFAPLTQWLALGRSSSLPEIRETLARTVHAVAKPTTGNHKYYSRRGVQVEPPPVDHIGGAQRAVMSLVIASMLVHGRHAEAIEHFGLSQYPGERLWHINFLIDASALDHGVELYRRPPTSRLFNHRVIHAISYGLAQDGQLDRSAAFLKAELEHIREYAQARPASKELAWNAQAPLLQSLSRLGRTDWEPPQPLSASEQASMEVGAVASLIAALRLTGREQDAERHRKRVHDYLEKQAAQLGEQRAQGKLPRLEHMFRPSPSPAEFDVSIEIERAYVFLYRGDLETAEKIVRSLGGDDQFARSSRSVVLSNLARWAARQRRWDKVEELLTIAIREPLFPQHWVHGAWLAVAADAQQIGQTELAARWAKNAGTAFCRLDPDRLERFQSSPAGHPGRRKPFVIPFLDSLYVLTAVREGRLPGNAR